MQSFTVTAGGASSAIDPIRYGQAWDVVFLAGRPSPGVCKIQGFERENGWQEKKGKGSLGATLTYTQKPPAKGSILFTLWTTADFLAWDIYRQFFIYNADKTPDQQAVSIYHPSLADIGVTSVVCKSISPAMHVGKGRYQIKAELIEYLPTPKQSVTATVSLTSPNGHPTLPTHSGYTATQAAKAGISTLIENLWKQT